MHQLSGKHKQAICNCNSPFFLNIFQDFKLHRNGCMMCQYKKRILYHQAVGINNMHSQFRKFKQLKLTGTI